MLKIKDVLNVKASSLSRWGIDELARPCALWAFLNVGKGTKIFFSNQIGTILGGGRELTPVN